jgi:uncharacterized damage-inducible protein DinB
MEGAAMTHSVVNELLDLLDAAFSGDDWHSLLDNLRDVSPEEWDWTPRGGRRSIRDIVHHIASCKLMYVNHAFGDAALDWDDPQVAGEDALATAASALAWLRASHQQLRQAVARLDDRDLSVPRLTNWGELRETRWIIAVMMQHDLYHAGEINHLRALHRGDDRWAHERADEQGAR